MQRPEDIEKMLGLGLFMDDAWLEKAQLLFGEENVSGSINTINGYQNQLNNQWQQANQQVPNGIQQAVPPAGQPVPQQAQYPPQSSTSSWWPFGDPNQFPPARATPAPPPSY